MSSLPQVTSLNTDEVKTSKSPSPSSRFSRVPVRLFVISAALVLYGLLVVYSAVSADTDYSFSRQLMGVALGVIVMILFWRFDYRNLSDLVGLLLVVNVILILSPHFPLIGVEAKGAQSWIKIGIQLQPGEFAKITVILLDASVMARYGGKLDDPAEYAKAVGIMLVPFFCIMTQPDLGTGLVYLFIGAVALVMGGARLKYLLITLAAMVVMVLMVLAVDEVIKNASGDYKILKQYQRNRLLVFLDENYDPDGEGYNLAQAKIAIGSGGWFGQGLFNGSQHRLGILPEAPTDFIFCVLAEELGFIGVLVMLVLYILLFITCIRIAQSSIDLFGMLIVSCIIGMWLFQILENVGMDCGLMPITGIPLPFFSYGSSFMMVNFALLGLVGSVYSHGTATHGNW